jgi:hypothetical protein
VGLHFTQSSNLALRLALYPALNFTGVISAWLDERFVFVFSGLSDRGFGKSFVFTSLRVYIVFFVAVTSEEVSEYL